MWHRVQRLRRRPAQALAVVLLGCLALGALGADWIAPHPPDRQQLDRRLEGPSPDFPLGTDLYGRCLLSRVIHGIRPSLGLAALIVASVAGVGVVVGTLAAYYPALDAVLMRITDCIFAFPHLVAALVLLSILPPGAPSLWLALVLPGWPKYARIARAAALAVRQEAYVEAAMALGAGDARLLVRTILPNSLNPVLSVATIDVGHKITAIAALGFLGLGLQPPMPEWGAMLNAGLPVLARAPHISLAPGIAIAISVLTFALMREAPETSVEAGREEKPRDHHTLPSGPA